MPSTHRKFNELADEAQLSWSSLLHPRTLFGLFSIFLLSTFTVVALMVCGSVIAPISRSFYRTHVSRNIVHFWVLGISFIFPRYTFVLTGDLPECDHSSKGPMSFLLCNHQIDSDWFFLWQIAQFAGHDGDVKIILKKELRNVPILGWGMELLEFILFDRNWQTDQSTLSNGLQRFVQDNYPAWIMLFPEGTTMSVENQQKGLAFAEKTGRPCLKRTLLPRSTGFAACVEHLSVHSPIIYDVLMSFHDYSGEVPTEEMGYSRKIDMGIPSLLDLAGGKSPQYIHIHIHKAQLKDIEDQGTEQWLDMRWQDHDKRMEHFILNKCLDIDGDRANAVEFSPQRSFFAVALCYMGLGLWFALVYTAINCTWQYLGNY